jgi:hypothetical protein
MTFVKVQTTSLFWPKKIVGMPGIEPPRAKRSPCSSATS